MDLKSSSITITPTTAGYHNLRNWSHRASLDPFWRIYRNEDDGGAIVSEGKKYYLEKGQCYLIPNKIPFDGVLEAERVYHLYVHYLVRLPLNNNHLPIYHVQVPGIHYACNKIIRHLKGEVKDRFELHFLSNQLIYTALSAIPKNHIHSTPIEEKIEEACSLMESNISAMPSNDAIAKVLGMSTNGFVRCFSKAMNMPPQSYGNHLRIEKATYYLNYSLMSIEEIAEELGFADRYHFSKVFKRHIYVGPSEYRKRNQS